MFHETYKTMKTFLAILLFFYLNTLSAQTANPDCNHLLVTNLQMNNDTANLMKVTIHNTCSSCASGLNGCVYMQLQVIRTVSPFDTLASSNCWCLWTPNNNSSRTYSVNAQVSSLPPLSNIRVSLATWSCGCDTIPFATLTDVRTAEANNTIQIYPNPIRDIMEIRNTDEGAFYTGIWDVTGKCILHKKMEAGDVRLDLNELVKGFYIIELSNENHNVLKKSKFIKD